MLIKRALNVREVFDEYFLSSGSNMIRPTRLKIRMRNIKNPANCNEKRQASVKYNVNIASIEKKVRFAKKLEENRAKLFLSI